MQNKMDLRMGWSGLGMGCKMGFGDQRAYCIYNMSINDSNINFLSQHDQD